MRGMRNGVCTPGSSQLQSHHAGCDRGRVSRRLNPALFELTMSSLRQAWLLGRLHRTSPVPFRGSYFTAESIFGSYAPTTHRLPVQPIGLRSIMLPSSIPPVRFVTHPGTPSLKKRRLAGSFVAAARSRRLYGRTLPQPAMPRTLGGLTPLSCFDYEGWSWDEVGVGVCFVNSGTGNPLQTGCQSHFHEDMASQM